MNLTVGRSMLSSTNYEVNLIDSIKSSFSGALTGLQLCDSDEGTADPEDETVEAIYAYSGKGCPISSSSKIRVLVMSRKADPKSAASKTLGKDYQYLGFCACDDSSVSVSDISEFLNGKASAIMSNDTPNGKWTLLVSDRLKKDLGLLVSITQTWEYDALAKDYRINMTIGADLCLNYDDTEATPSVSYSGLSKKPRKYSDNCISSDELIDDINALGSLAYVIKGSTTTTGSIYIDDGLKSNGYTVGGIAFKQRSYDVKIPVKSKDFVIGDDNDPAEIGMDVEDVVKELIDAGVVDADELRAKVSSAILNKIV